MTKEQRGVKNHNYRHGKFGTRIYKIWDGMYQRCNNKKCKDYPTWGGRGIGVCARWSDFVKFYEDMGEAPAGMSLDRVDNNGPYSKENCRWATWKQQQRNRRTNKLLTHKGQTKTMAEWIEETGINKNTFEWRIANGWSADRAITTKAPA